MKWISQRILFLRNMGPGRRRYYIQMTAELWLYRLWCKLRGREFKFPNFSAESGKVYRTTKQIPGICLRLFGETLCLTPGVSFEYAEHPICQSDDHTLVELLGNSQADSLDRVIAVNLLGIRQRREAVPNLLQIVESRELVLNSSPPDVLIKASLFALGQIGDPRAGPVIMDVARSEPELAGPAIVALGLLAYEPAIPLLNECVQSASDAEVRTCAAGVLKNYFGRNEGLDVLWPLLLSTNEDEYELAANAFLGVEEKARDALFTDMVASGLFDKFFNIVVF